MAAALLAAAPFAAAQEAQITEQRVRETVEWLAADERRGRDTGSPELDEAADWLLARFAAAGLEQLVEHNWFHEFTMPGRRLDSTQTKLTLRARIGERDVEVVCAPDRDVRQATASDVLMGNGEGCTVASIGDPVLQRLLTAASARRLIVVEVPEEHAHWRAAEGGHGVLGSVRQASRPVLLVRAGLLPELEKGAEPPAWTATWSVAAPEPADVVQRNVVGVRRGGGLPDEYVLVSAHYDHVGVGREVDGDAIYNGADDNATGTTAVVLLAEALAKLEPPPRRSVVFVCFAAEERGLAGSRAFAADPPVPLEQIVANLNVEMIGRPAEGNAGKAWITGAGYSDFAAIVAPALQQAGVGLVEFPLAERLFAASDNYPLARRGVVAHSLSAGSLHADYHQPGDEADQLDVPHMTRIVRGLFAATLELANRDARPQWNDEGRRRLARQPRTR